MPVFAYKARDRSGKAEEGLLQASSEKAAARTLQQLGRYVVDLRRKDQPRRLPDIRLHGSLPWRRPVDARQLSGFCRQLAALVDAGIPMCTSLSMVARRLRPPALQRAAQQVALALSQGETLISALEQQRHVFPELFVRLVETGEAGGVLDQSLHRLADHYDKESAITRKIRAALLYPALVLATAGGSTVFFFLYVIPAYSALLTSLGMGLPEITRFVLALAKWIGDYGLWMMLSAALGFFGLRRLMQKGGYRILLEKALLRAPVLGGLLHRAAIARVSRSLSILVGSGVPIIQALAIVEKVALYRSLAEAVRGVRSGVGKGHPLHQMMERSPLFPPEFVHLVYIGEESGALDVLLEKTAEYFEAEVDGAVHRLMILLEPMLLFLMAGVVGFLALSLLMPLFEMINGTP
ncbi:type ii secretion system f domain protein [Heliomicrobium modesticaldum Ice1]|uniref:Type ii secretion system f domain protein n=1 Tax=Heliobacterium modesticaldum (strain ATCC 51547 / Ice1) TaxID=498761 RepID=B0TEF9_HELMI|nr:type II secretion system F family protein [Heliomicrobium modesticaldum]ABZ82878.1 type ii secretion system f domain protein [Heliomicrobium modesticaldum Ice1]